MRSLQEQQTLRKCVQCDKEKTENDCPRTRWGQVLAKRICLECVSGRSCCSCGRQGSFQYFPTAEWDKPDSQRKCYDCCPNDVLAAESRKPKGRIPRNSGNCQREELYVKLATAGGATVVAKKKVSGASLLPRGHCLKILLICVVCTALVVAAAMLECGLATTEGANN